MGRVKWQEIKRSKLFYVNTYRRVSSVLLVSIGLNAILGTVLYFVYINQPGRDFYATNGITSPEKLTPLLEPNYASEALLAPDREDSTYKQKVIPR